MRHRSAPPANALRLSALPLLALTLAAGSALAAQTPEERILLLEAKLNALTERVQALEGATAPEAASQPDNTGVAWPFGAAVSGTPLRVSHKSFDINKGRLDLLLEITAPLPDAAAWRTGNPSPLAVTLRSPAGTNRTLPMTLLRGARLEPGGQLHQAADMEPALTAAATQLQIHRIGHP